MVLTPETLARATRLFHTLDFTRKGYLDSHTFGLSGHPHAKFYPPLRDTWERFLVQPSPSPPASRARCSYAAAPHAARVSG